MPSKQLLKDLPTPAFVINRYAFAKNCQTALDHARKHNLKLRPHVKTHKTVEGAFLQATGQINFASSAGSSFDSTVSGFVASTLPEVAMLVGAAEKYGGAPFNDILFGVPIAESKLSRLFELQQKLDGHIRIMVDHVEQIHQVEKFVDAAENNFPKLSTFLKLDTGYHRAGVPCDERGVQVAMAVIRSPALDFFGVYSHW
jgi:D-serine deaminase-like pyridoxal phosphate-dependent protein